MRFTGWWVDGHFVLALSATEARESAASQYGFTPETVRRWTKADQEAIK